MPRIHFVVLGNPKAQKRHRSWQRGQARGTYDPSAADKADFLALCRDNAPDRPIEGVVILRIWFFMAVPKSAPKGQKNSVEQFDEMWGELDMLPAWPMIPDSAPYYLKRPDTDNLLKLIKDSMTGIYWKDDSQVQIGGAFKIYSHRPRTEIEIIF